MKKIISVTFIMFVVLNFGSLGFCGFEETLKKAQKGDAKSQYEIGHKYYIDFNFDKAGHWFAKAAEQGHSAAQTYLGTMYFHGYGVKKDYKIAYALYSVAAAGGIKNAVRLRDKVAERMMPQLLSEAQDLAYQWYQKYGSSM